MTRHTGLRQDTAAYRALSRLVDLGGTALPSRLADVLPVEFQRVARLKQSVIEPLERRGFVTINDDRIHATPKGKRFVSEIEAQQLPATVPYVAQIAQPRTSPPSKPLDISKHCPKLVSVIRREGALEYRGYPSLMAGQRINRYES